VEDAGTSSASLHPSAPETCNSSSVVIAALSHCQYSHIHIEVRSHGNQGPQCKLRHSGTLLLN